MAKDISSEHYADVQKIGRDRAEREKIKQKQERAAARVARQPEAVKKIDLQLQRIEFLKMAAQITVGPGELFTKFAAIAGSVALITERLCERKNWRVGRPQHWADDDEFLSFFGVPGDPAMCMESFRCGLVGHLFGEDSDHASADLIVYIDGWIAELKGQRASIFDQATVTRDSGNGVSQDFSPDW